MNDFFRGLLNGVVNIVAQKVTGKAQPSVGIHISLDLTKPIGPQLEPQIEQDALAALDADAKRDFGSP